MLSTKQQPAAAPLPEVEAAETKRKDKNVTNYRGIQANWLAARLPSAPLYTGVYPNSSLYLETVRAHTVPHYSPMQPSVYPERHLPLLLLRRSPLAWQIRTWKSFGYSSYVVLHSQVHKLAVFIPWDSIELVFGSYAPLNWVQRLLFGIKERGFVTEEHICLFCLYGQSNFRYETGTSRLPLRRHTCRRVFLIWQFIFIDVLDGHTWISTWTQV